MDLFQVELATRIELPPQQELLDAVVDLVVALPGQEAEGGSTGHREEPTALELQVPMPLHLDPWAHNLRKLNRVHNWFP